jgi:hypothetical protein
MMESMPNIAFVNKKNRATRCWGLEVELPSLLISALSGGEWSPRLGRFTHGKGPQYPLNRKLGGSQGGLDVFRREKSRAFTPIRTPDVPARSHVPIPITLSS